MTRRRLFLTAALALAVVAAPQAHAAPPQAAAVDATADAAGFVPGSTSWTSPDSGWVHGFTSCEQAACARLRSTVDGGATWTARTAPPLGFPAAGDGVDIAFAPPRDGGLASVGFATDGRRVFATTDGASSWDPITLTGVDGRAAISDIVVTSRRVYAIVGQGDTGSGRTDLYSARLHQHSWRPVDGVTLDGNGVNVDGGWDIVANGRHVAVSLGRIFVSSAFWTSHDATTFTESDAPCTADQVTALGAVTARRVAALCSYEPGMGAMFKDLYVSERGAPFEAAGSAPVDGITEEYVSLAPGEDVITAVTGAALIYRSTAEGWDTALSVQGFPFSDLQFVDRSNGYVVWGGPRSERGKVYRTVDGGHSWSPVTG